MKVNVLLMKGTIVQKGITDEYVLDLFALTYEELKEKYNGKPASVDSWQKSKRYYIRKYNLSDVDYKGNVSSNLTPEETATALTKLCEEKGINPNEIQSIERVQFGDYQQVTKDPDTGEATIHTLQVRKLLFKPKIDIDKSFINQARATIVRPTKVPKPIREDTVTMCFGDAQIGYHKDETFHDERALSLILQAVAKVRPDNIVLTGDMLDLPSMSKFAQYSEWQNSTQKSIDAYHMFLAQLRATAPDADIIVVHGNHELRMDKSLRMNAAEFFGLRRALADNEFPVLSVAYLVRYGDLNVRSVDGWPNADWWLEDNLRVTHGTFTKKGGSNAAKYLQEDYSTIFGHTHRLELAYRSIPIRYGERTIAAASPGCLAKTDGIVPGFSHSTDEFGNIVKRAEDWQQGALVITHNPEHHDITLCRIDKTGINVFGEKIKG